MLVLAGQDVSIADSIETVTIKASRIDPQRINKNIEHLSPSLVETLQEVSSLQIQSNGPGYLATVLIHGFGARHTAVIWEEFNIQSPINGTFDLSLINGFDRVSYAESSLSAYLGTASLAGGIVIADDQNTQGTDIRLRTDSNRNLSTRIGHQLSIGDFNTGVQLNYIRNQNEFNYRWNQEVQTWQAEVRGQDLKWFGKYKLSEVISIKGDVWLQNYDRTIPSSLVSSGELSNQEDINYRFAINSTYTKNNTAAKLSYAFFEETINFQTSGIDSRASNKVNAVNLSLKHTHHRVNVSHRQDKTDANFFNTIHSRNLSLFSYSYNKSWSSKLRSNVVLSRQINDGTMSPWLYSLSSGYNSGSFGAQLTFNRSYNVPTFNDLYWPQGGNADLMPELANGIDLELKYNYLDQFSISVSPYLQLVDNWILWTPDGSIWSPKNQRKVTSKGVDLNAMMSLSNSISSQLNLSYTNVTVAEELNFNELIGKQLIYVPRFKSTWSLNYTLAKFRLRPIIQYVSKRYTTSDNNSDLPAYTLLNFNASRDIEIGGNKKVEIGIQVNNLTNKDYQQIQFYPMPLRYVGISINYKSNK